MAMTEKEVKARYKHAVLGFLWIVLNPLLQMMVIGFIFQFFVPYKIDNYFLFLFVGLLPWNFFSYSLTKTTPSIVNERALIQKARFPREGIVISIVLSTFFHFFISLVLLLGFLLFTYVVGGQFSTDLLAFFLRMGAFVLTMIWLCIFTIGLSLLLSALNVFYRDINFIVQVAVQLWFYATPVVYSLNVLPKWLTPWVSLNPLTGVVELLRFSLLGTEITQPSWILYGAVASLVVTIVGWWFFAVRSGTFDDYV